MRAAFISRRVNVSVLSWPELKRRWKLDTALARLEEKIKKQII